MMIFNRNRWTILAMFFMTAIFSAAIAQPDTEDSESKELADPLRIIASVNGEDVTQSQLEFHYLQIMYYYGGDMSEEMLERRRPQFDQQAMDNALRGALIRYLGRERGLTPSDDEVRAARDQIAEMLGADSETKVNQILERRGIPQVEVDRFILTHLTNLRLFESYNEDNPTTITTNEARVFYEDHPELHSRPPVVSLRHIFFETLGLNEEQKAEKRKKAEETLKRLREGADFAEVAREVSEGPSAKSGGDLGRIGPGDTEPEIEKAAFALEVGEISDIVESKYGYHIVTVYEKRPSESLSFERVKPYLIETMKYQTARRDYQDWLQRELEDAIISIDR